MPLPPAMIPAAVVLVLIGGIGPNLLLALMSVGVLIVGCMLLWRPGEPPILLFVFAFPWMQGSIAIYHANWLEIGLADYAPFVGDTLTAVMLSLAGLIALAAGMRLGAGPRRLEDVIGLRQTALSQPLQRWFWLYAMAWAVGFLGFSFAWVVPGLTQLMLAVVNMKWAFFFLLAFACFVQDSGRKLFPLVFFFELLGAIGGFFSDFKTVFFVTFFAAVASGVRLSPRALLASGALVVMVLALGIVWTSIKGEFRAFVSGGQGQQVVTVDYLTRLSRLAELAGDLNGEALAKGTDQLLRRLSYVEFFAVVLTIVPGNVPHTQGAILWDSVARVATPRLFFSDKEAIDDTARTNLYTGGQAGTSEGTSISLGFIAEAYIDFGVIGMFAGLFAIGIFYGTLYRSFLRWSASRGLLGMAVTTAVLISVGDMGNSFTKVFGGVVVSLLVAWAMVALVVPRLAPWLVPGRR